jgi:hypothetical protein
MKLSRVIFIGVLVCSGWAASAEPVCVKRANVLITAFASWANVPKNGSEEVAKSILKNYSDSPYVGGANGSGWRLDSERTAPVKATQRLTVANPSLRRHWAAKVISATGKPGRGPVVYFVR